MLLENNNWVVRQFALKALSLSGHLIRETRRAGCTKCVFYSILSWPSCLAWRRWLLSLKAEDETAQQLWSLGSTLPIVVTALTVMKKWSLSWLKMFETFNYFQAISCLQDRDRDIRCEALETFLHLAKPDVLISSARSLLFDCEQAVQVDSNCGCGPMSIKEIIPKIAPKGDENAILSMMACLTDGERDVRETCAANAYASLDKTWQDGLVRLWWLQQGKGRIPGIYIVWKHWPCAVCTATCQDFLQRWILI